MGRVKPSVLLGLTVKTASKAPETISISHAIGHLHGAQASNAGNVGSDVVDDALVPDDGDRGSDRQRADGRNRRR
ncbi:uncharacterized protein RMCT_0630 [Mycolicibacterium thermoresistibile]|uniref:Uncharacterized protein n=1 Tax=Mycolicibacterium thermoresistibile TaxID=1797 RepID=A0A124E7U5_MYCTH|nr:uncharacterized protein RMCT_0630 [Mycolicibacterium thermoresistibile]